MLRRTSTLAATFIAIAAGLALTACSKTAEEPKEAAAEPAPAPAAEPAPAPKVENTKPLMVGDLQAMAVRDGTWNFRTTTRFSAWAKHPRKWPRC